VAPVGSRFHFFPLGHSSTSVFSFFPGWLERLSPTVCAMAYHVWRHPHISSRFVVQSLMRFECLIGCTPFPAIISRPFLIVSVMFLLVHPLSMTACPSIPVLNRYVQMYCFFLPFLFVPLPVEEATPLQSLVVRPRRLIFLRLLILAIPLGVTPPSLIHGCTAAFRALSFLFPSNEFFFPWRCVVLS